MTEFTMAKFVRGLRKAGELETRPNSMGHECKIWRLFTVAAERYLCDFAPDFKSDGWEQFDTDHDASYFGVWLNKGQRLVLSFAEGDWTLTESPDVEAYRVGVQELCDFHGEGKIATTIDKDGNVTVYRQDRAEFLK